MAKRFLKAVVSAVITCAFFIPAHGESEKTGARELSLEEFIELSAANDKVFEEILVENLKLNYRKKLKLPADDIVMSVKNRYVAFLRPDKGKPEYSFSLAKLFPYTGTEVEAGYFSTVRGPGGGDVDADLYAIVSQPIARNAFGKTNRLLDRIVGLEVEIAGYQIVEAYEAYLEAMIKVYYGWNESYENLRTAENSYRESRRMLDNVRERQKSNIALAVDVNKVYIQVLLKEETLIEARNSFMEQTNLVKKSIGYDIGDVLVPVESDPFDGMDIDFESEYRVFREHGRTSVILEMLEKKSALEVDKFADALLPSIDLFAEYRIKSPGRYFEKDDKRVMAGFSLDYPFPGQVEKAEYETSRVEHKRNVLARHNAHIRIYTELRNIYDKIQKQKELIEIARRKIRVGEEIVKDDTLNYSYGRQNLNNLIDEINRLDRHRFNKIQRSILLKKLVIEWLSLTDRLVRDMPEIGKSPAYGTR